jgi:hypothetical protein
MTDFPPGKQPYSRDLRGFGNLDYRGDIQRGAAARTLLTGHHPRIFPAQINLGRNRVGADWTMGQSLSVTFNECFHLFLPLHSIRRKNLSTGCTKFVNILKAQRDKGDNRAGMLR